jgi:hypothetical protein
VSYDTANNNFQEPDYVKKPIESIHNILNKLKLTDEEREGLKCEITELEDTVEKLRKGGIEITAFGEVSSGKSSVLNALLRTHNHFETGARHGSTTESKKEVWRTVSSGECQVKLVDTPGINEVDGKARAQAAVNMARNSELVLFVVDGDINEVEYAALYELYKILKPIILVINKYDLYTKKQQNEINEAIRSRVGDIISPENIVFAAASPKECVRVIVHPDGREEEQDYQPQVDIENLELRILDILEKEGKALTALNASLFTNKVSDNVRQRIVEIRTSVANRVVDKFMWMKALTIAANPAPVVDLIAAAGFDGAMVMTIGNVYGMQPTWKNSQNLMFTIAKCLGALGLLEGNRSDPQRMG